MKNGLQMVALLVLMAGLAYWIHGVDAETHQAVRDYVSGHAWAANGAYVIAALSALMVYLFLYWGWISIRVDTAIRNLQNTQNQGRNEHCACGSGKKFKNCCAHRVMQAKNRALLIDAAIEHAHYHSPLMARLFWPVLVIHKRLRPKHLIG